MARGETEQAHHPENDPDRRPVPYPGRIRFRNRQNLCGNDEIVIQLAKSRDRRINRQHGNQQQQPAADAFRPGSKKARLLFIYSPKTAMTPPERVSDRLYA